MPLASKSMKILNCPPSNPIFKLDDIDGVYRTESMISLEESINDKKRLMHAIFSDI